MLSINRIGFVIMGLLLTATSWAGIAIEDGGRTITYQVRCSALSPENKGPEIVDFIFDTPILGSEGVNTIYYTEYKETSSELTVYAAFFKEMAVGHPVYRRPFLNLMNFDQMNTKNGISIDLSTAENSDGEKLQPKNDMFELVKDKNGQVIKAKVVMTIGKVGTIDAVMNCEEVPH